MIPSLLLFGLVLGGLAHDRTSFVLCSTVLVAVALAWGLVVGVADGEASTFVGGAAIAFANLTVAASVSLLVRLAGRWFAGENAATSH